MRDSLEAVGSVQKISPKQALREVVHLIMDIERLVGVPLVEPQILVSTEIARCVLAGGLHELDLLWCRRFGKTEMNVQTALALGLYWVYRCNQPFSIGLVNPARNEQSIMVTRARLQERITQLETWMLLTLGVAKILGDGRKTPDIILKHESSGAECSIRAISADASAHEKGAGFNLMFLEQVEEMDEAVMLTTIFPMVTGQELECTQVLAGTPSLEVENHYFHELSQKLEYPWLVDDRTAQQFRQSYAGIAAKEKERLGENSDAYQTQYRCHWVKVRNRLTNRDMLLELAISHKVDMRNTHFAGTDVAKDVDRTVCTMLERVGSDLIIVDWREWEGTDYETQAEELHVFVDEYQARKNVVDARGPGAVLVDMLRKRGDTPIEEVKATDQSNNTMYTIYERELTHKRLLYLAPVKGEHEALTRCRNRFIEEHVDVERHIKNNKLKLEAPQRRGYHDDYVSSAALGVFGALEGQGSDPTAVFAG